MGVISSIPRSVNVLGRHPVIFGGAFVLTAVTTAPNILQYVTPALAIVGSLLSLFVAVFVNPFLVGGMLGMANEGAQGKVDFGAFLQEGKDNYLSLLVGWILIFVVEAVLGFILFLVYIFVLALVVGVGVGIGTGGGGGRAAMGGVGLLAALVTLVFVLVFVLPIFLVQYFPAAVVVEDRSFSGAFKRAFSVLTSNLPRTIGFDLVMVAVGILSALVVWAVLFAVAGVNPLDLGAGQSTTPGAGPGTGGTSGLAFAMAYLGLSVVLGTVIGAFQYTYYTVFFRDITGGEYERAGGRGQSARR